MIYSVSVPASKENWRPVSDFLTQCMKNAEVGNRKINEVLLASEEIFVNIARYAYRRNDGEVSVRFVYDAVPMMLTVEFVDSGVPFDPTAFEPTAFSGSAEERPIGGLGIFMVKCLVDSMQYKYNNGKNSLKIIVKIN